MSHEQPSQNPENLYIHYVGNGAEIGAVVGSAEHWQELGTVGNSDSEAHWNGLDSATYTKDISSPKSEFPEWPEEVVETEPSKEHVFDVFEQARLAMTDEAQAMLNMGVWVALEKSTADAEKDKPNDLSMLQTRRIVESLGRKPTDKDIAAAHVARYFVYDQLPGVTFEKHAGKVYQKYIEQEFPAADWYMDALELRDEHFPEEQLFEKTEAFLGFADLGDTDPNLIRAVIYSTIAQASNWQEYDAFKHEVFALDTRKIDALVGALLARPDSNK